MKKQFWLGLLLGMLIGAWVRRRKIEGVTQERLDNYYRRRAKNYNLTDYLYLGQFPRVEMRKKLIAMSSMKAGDQVLDFACGAGANIPYVMEKIGPTGRLVLFDYSAEMLDAARDVVKKHGWANVEFVQGDAAQMRLDAQFDVVMCTLGMAVIPRWEEALERGWEHIKPGGVYAIGDLSESDRWYAKPLAFLNDLIDAAIIADSSRRPWEWLRLHGSNYRREELFHGYFYVATANKPLKIA